MHKIIAIVLVAATLVPGAAMAERHDKQTFTRDGKTYRYSSVIRGKTEVIDGENETDGVSFHLVVRNGWVSGTSDGLAIAFPVPARTTAEPIRTAAR